LISVSGKTKLARLPLQAEIAVKTRIIVNPMANKGNCGKRWPQILAEFEKHLGPVSSVDVAMTRAPNHATALAQEAVSTGCQRLISVGGDGTFNEMVNGVISDDRPIAPDLVLAQLPGGTSNELCRSFGQLSLGEACKAIAMGHTRDVDVFRADARGYGGGQVTRYGLVLAIIGAAATISWRAQRVPLLKRLGPFSYVLMTAFTSLTYNPRPYRVRIDDEAEQNLRMWSVMLCSFDGAGEGLMLAPGADPADRKLDLIMVGDIGHWETLTKIVPRLGDGSYLAHPQVSRRHASRISIDSDTMVRADVDGESIGQLPMSVTMLPFHLKVAAVNRV
jgi:YegS/Rv2252/BmrU family lipid kinase